MKADAERLPRFEAMRQHQQLRLSIDRRPNRRTGKPRVANFASIGQLAPVTRRPASPTGQLFTGDVTTFARILAYGLHEERWRRKFRQRIWFRRPYDLVTFINVAVCYSIQNNG